MSSRIPVLVRADALVVEGTLGGCIVAHTLALTGRQTVLAITSTSLPYEIVVCRRPWTRDSLIARLPEPFRNAFRASVWRRTAAGEPLLNLAMLATKIEDVLFDAGVRIFYGLTPCGVARDRNQSLAGIVFGGKFGLAAIPADDIVDCTPTAVVATLAGHAPAVRPCAQGPIDVCFSAKVGMADEREPIIGDRRQRNACPTVWPDESELRVAGVPALKGGKVVLHGPYADFSLRLPFDVGDPFAYSRLSVRARECLIEAGTRISKRRAAEGKRPLYFHRFSGGLLMGPAVRIHSVGGSPYRLRGAGRVWVCGPSADVPDSTAIRLADPWCVAPFAGEVAAGVLRQPGRNRLTVRADLVGAGEGAPIHGLRFGAPSNHATGECLHLNGPVLPLLADCEVLVAGGGTSGVPAALAAAQSGARTILIEQMDDLGGVRSTGGVASYWFGRETPYQRACDDAYDRCSDQSGMAEELAMLRVLREAGVTVLTHLPLVGVVREGDRVTGAVVATDCGLGVVRGSVTIDATGDADLTAWAGAPFEYGNGRDAWTMWASFANFNEEKRTASRMYESAIQIDDPWDIARTIIRGRRRQGMWAGFAHEMSQHYVAPRESRRIVGRATVTYGGILVGETFPDVMVVGKCNFDIKGIATSDLINSGLVWSWRTRTNFIAPIPYRAILPKGVENLLVAGRAYSISHDALALARMQRDMVSLGAAAGIAAAMSVRTGQHPAEVDFRTLQAEWVRRGILRRDDLRRYGQAARPYRTADAERDVMKLLSGRDPAQRGLARLMSATSSIAPLRRALPAARTPEVRTKIARALCFLGDARAVPLLLDRVARQTARRLPPAKCRTLAFPPEHGWAPDPAYSLYAIAMAGRGRDAAALLTRIAAAVADDPAAFNRKRESPFEYIKTICAVAERNPGPEMIAPLEALLGKRSLRGASLRYDGDMRLALDPAHERRAYLELCIGRALARCADRRGYDILLDYLDDVRGPLARSAAEELADLVGAPRGQPTRAAWTRRVAACAASLRMRPFDRRID